MEQVDRSAIEVRGLNVFYGRGSARRQAVEDLTFSVARGETVGFIGPNGAGKSSTMKSLMGFIFPESGSATLLGEPAGLVASRERTGYLPEVSLYYPFMKAREVLELYGGLQGLGRRELKTRVPELLERVGLAGKGEILLKNFSKGMQQRVGIAQAIIADPDLLIFDELSSGLDPVGRYDLREVLFDLKRRGRTIFFTRMNCMKFEALCDRVVMIHQGRKLCDRNVAELLADLKTGKAPESRAGMTLEEYFMALVRPEIGQVAA